MREWASQHPGSVPCRSGRLSRWAHALRCSGAIVSVLVPLWVPEGMSEWPPGPRGLPPGPRHRRPLAPGSEGAPPAAAGWRRTGRAPGLAVSSQGSHTRAPASWSVSASLCRYMHAQGQQRPQRRRSRAGRRSRPGLAPSTPNSPRAQQGLPGPHPRHLSAPAGPAPGCPSLRFSRAYLTIRAQSTPPPPGSLPGLIRHAPQSLRVPGP